MSASWKLVARQVVNTNPLSTSYDRYWEGRKCFSTLTANVQYRVHVYPVSHTYTILGSQSVSHDLGPRCRSSYGERRSQHPKQNTNFATHSRRAQTPEDRGIAILSWLCLCCKALPSWRGRSRLLRSERNFTVSLLLFRLYRPPIRPVLCSDAKLYLRRQHYRQTVPGCYKEGQAKTQQEEYWPAGEYPWFNHTTSRRSSPYCRVPPAYRSYIDAASFNVRV